jgi:hypothetical protein
MAKKKRIDAIIENTKDKRSIKGSKKILSDLEKNFRDSDIAKALNISPQKWGSIKSRIKSGKLYSPDLKNLLTEKSVSLFARGKSKKQNEFKKGLKRLDREISKTQKAIKEKKPKKKIDRDLKNFLKDQGITEKEFRKQSRKIQKELKEEFRETRPSRGGAGEWYYPNTKTLNQDYKNVKVASYRHASYESALNWWKGVTGGAGYFVILRKKSKKTGRELFFVMDIDPSRRRKGTSKKVSDYQSDRALKLEEKFREAEDF